MKFNAETERSVVVVPNQLFVSISTHISSSSRFGVAFAAAPLRPTQERSRAARYQVSPDLQHVLFAFEVKAVSSIDITPTPLSSVVPPPQNSDLFVSTDLPALLRGQVHYLQPRDAVRTTSVGVGVSFSDFVLSLDAFSCSLSELG